MRGIPFVALLALFAAAGCETLGISDASDAVGDALTGSEEPAARPVRPKAPDVPPPLPVRKPPPLIAPLGPAPAMEETPPASLPEAEASSIAQPSPTLPRTGAPAMAAPGIEPRPDRPTAPPKPEVNAAPAMPQGVDEQPRATPRRSEMLAAPRHSEMPAAPDVEVLPLTPRTADPAPAPAPETVPETSPPQTEAPAAAPAPTSPESGLSYIPCRLRGEIVMATAKDCTQMGGITLQ